MKVMGEWKEFFLHGLNIIVDVLSNRVNFLNIAVISGAIYAHVFISILSIATNIAFWLQTSLGILSILFLAIYNGLKAYREWKKS